MWRRKVDPVSGKPSTADNAISYSAFKERRKVDPLTGKPSIADNAISIGAFRLRRKVDPVTGKDSTADNAITYAAFRKRRKVDPVTGKSSAAEDAISYSTFRKRKKVDLLKATEIDGANARLSISSDSKKRTVGGVISTTMKRSVDAGFKYLCEAAKRARFDFVINSTVSGGVMGGDNVIKSELDNYKLVF